MLIYLLITYICAPFIYIINFLKYKLIKKGKKDKFSKILIIQTAKIGDLVQTTPIFREIKKYYSNVKLDVLVSPAACEILELNPYIDSIITFAKEKELKGLKGKFNFIKFLYKKKYDLVIALNPDPAYGICMFWAGVPTRISIKPYFSGFTKKLSFFLYTYLQKHTKDTLIIETYFNILKALHINSTNWSKEIYLSPENFIKPSKFLEKQKRPFIGIIISSGNKLKSLPFELWTQIIKSLFQELNECTLFLIGSSEDKKIATKILKEVKNFKIIDTTGEFSLREAAAFIKNLDLLIGVDTGLIYFADTFKIPIVHIPGPANYREQRPWEAKVIEILPKINCAPCTYTFKTTQLCKIRTRECITATDPKEIAKAAKKLVNKLNLINKNA